MRPQAAKISQAKIKKALEENDGSALVRELDELKGSYAAMFMLEVLAENKKHTLISAKALCYIGNLKPMKATKLKPGQPPKIGDIIYVGTSLYIDHGEDDFVGGLATVSRVYKQMSGGEMVDWVEIDQRPRHGYNWTCFLSGRQSELAAEFGNKVSYPDPDYG